jgi:hypothetical protein
MCEDISEVKTKKGDEDTNVRRSRRYGDDKGRSKT